MEKNYDSDVNSDFQSYYEHVLVKDQPFYRQGMTIQEANREQEYLNANLDLFFRGEYTPLWKQNLYK
ncbi:MAG: hypothetical protein ACI4D8_06285 [Wujia sp.]